MRTTFRLIVLMFAISTVLSIYSLSYLTIPVNACVVGWNYCILPNGGRQEGGPGDRRGCSVRSYNPFDDPDLSAYVYTCNGQETTCYYAHRCPSGDQNPEMEEPPQY